MFQTIVDEKLLLSMVGERPWLSKQAIPPPPLDSIFTLEITSTQPNSVTQSGSLNHTKPLTKEKGSHTRSTLIFQKRVCF